jgi:hypothetical protein
MAAQLDQNNDFVIGNSDEDHIIDIINSNQGDWKSTFFAVLVLTTSSIVRVRS